MPSRENRSTISLCEGKVSTIESDKLESALTRKGFELEKQKKDHKYYRLYVEGKKTSVLTKVSHGQKYTISKYLFGITRQQMKFENNSELELFVNCEIDKNTYIKMMVDRGFVRLSSF